MSADHAFRPAMPGGTICGTCGEQRHPWLSLPETVTLSFEDGSEAVWKLTREQADVLAAHLEETVGQPDQVGP